jgi:hypothetical protein
MAVLNVVCVQTGNYLGRGLEYVRNLHRMVEEHLSLPHRFVCLTDSPIRGIDCIASKHEGWWEKLRIFQPGLFSGRVMFLDLDTLILGNIDHVASYDGHFATLHDFWRGERGLGPAVMLFDPKWAGSLYEEWAGQGFPTLGSDQIWLENRDQGRFMKMVDILQSMHPGEFVSYKEHCTSGKRSWRGNLADQLPPPDGARVVCFHGRPRVHEVGGWVREVWEGAWQAA